MTLPHCAKGQAVTTERLHVRAAPKIAGTSFGILPEGLTVTVWSVAEGWAIVQAESGLTGYANMEYLTPVAKLVP